MILGCNKIIVQITLPIFILLFIIWVLCIFVFSRVLTLIETNETQNCSAVSSKRFFWMRNFVVYIFDSSIYNLTTLTNIWSIKQFKIISSTHQIKELDIVATNADCFYPQALMFDRRGYKQLLMKILTS